VAGRPEEKDLDASRVLRLVVVPYAGVPPATLARVRARPSLSLATLHHNAVPTAEMAVALLLAAARGIVPADQALRRGDWTLRYAEDRGVVLAGRTAVVLGFGAIGRRVAEALVGLGMKVRAVRRHVPADAEEGARVAVHGPGDLDVLLPAADALVVALPLTPETRGLLDARRLALLPRGALVVNVARGEVIDEDALYEALAAGRLGGAGLDAWWRYPAGEEDRGRVLPSQRPFHELDRVVMSPHRAGHAAPTEALRAEHLGRLLGAVARGEEIPGRVDLAVGY